jgi:hypothetical protein
MAGNRTLKLSILADTADLVKGLNKAQNETEKSGSRIGSAFAAVGKAAALAGAAVAAYGVKLAVDGVKAAIEDEAAQVRLANSLKNTTDATDAQIRSVERQILATSLAVGVADDQLRPALDRLTRSTRDVTKSQDLLDLALNISAGTGKSLESVTNALAKSHDGQNTALGRLGIGIDQTKLRTMSFEDIQKSLNQTFAGASAVAAETYEGKLRRMRVALDEAKESIGAALLPTLANLTDAFVKTGLPALNNFIAGLTGKGQPNLEESGNRSADALERMSGKTGDLETASFQLGDALRDVVRALGDLFGEFDKTGNKNGLAGFVDSLSTIAKFLADIIRLAGKVGDALGNINERLTFTPRKPVIDLPEVLKDIGEGLFGDRGRSNPGRTSSLSPFAANSGNVTINVNAPSVIDEEGFARAVGNALSNSSARGGTVTTTPAFAV